jgi:hypothetical protein
MLHKSILEMAVRVSRAVCGMLAITGHAGLGRWQRGQCRRGPRSAPRLDGLHESATWPALQAFVKAVSTETAHPVGENHRHQ